MKFVLLAFILCSGVGSQPAAQSEAALERGLASIQPVELRADVDFFADRELGGRATPSLGQRVAARFLAARLKRLAWQPAGDPQAGGAPRSWFQEFEVYRRALDLKRSRLSLLGGPEELSFGLGKDYFVTRFEEVRNAVLGGPVVYCGAGETGALEGAWALCLTSGRPQPQRVERLEASGALGILWLWDPLIEADPIGKRYGRAQRAKTRAKLYAGSPAVVEIPFTEIYLARALARSLLQMEAGRAQALPAEGTRLALQLREQRLGSGSERVENVCAFLPGSDPELRSEVLILSAHYDHLTPIGARVFPGADDNASGSMALLALAQAMDAYGSPKRSIFLLWTTAEEHGLLGSKHFADHPGWQGLLGNQVLRPRCNINLDMLGRNAADELLMTPSSQDSHASLGSRLRELAPLESFRRLGSADEYWKRSDHYSFFTTMGIPVVFLFSGVHRDYHKATDTPDKLNIDKLCRATRLVLRLLDRLQAGSLTL